MFMDLLEWVDDGLWEKAVAESGSPAPNAAVALAGRQEGDQFVCWVGGVFDGGDGSLASAGRRVQFLDGRLGWSVNLLCCPTTLSSGFLLIAGTDNLYIEVFNWILRR